MTHDMEVLSTLALTSATVVLAVVSIGVAVVIYMVVEFQKKFKKDFEALRQQHEKSSHLVFAISNLAIATLPKATFTQQVPSLILENMGIVNEIFEGPAGVRLWDSMSKFPTISRHPTAARLAYSIAVYRLATYANRRDLLVGKDTGSLFSVVQLLDWAASRSGAGKLSDLLLGDILVRKCQALRQAGTPADLDEAEQVADALIANYFRSPVQQLRLWGPWCKALVYLQRGALAVTRQERARCFKVAVDMVQSLAPSGPSPSSAIHSPDSDTFETSSLTYYLAKALWAYRMSVTDIHKKEDEIPNFGVVLRRAVIVSIESLELSRHRADADPCIRAVYSFCLALTIAAALELPETRDTFFNELKGPFCPPLTAADMTTHATECLHLAEQVLDAVTAGDANGLGTFIYCERTERLDTIATFRDEIRWVQDALNPRSDGSLRKFYTLESTCIPSPN